MKTSEIKEMAILQAFLPGCIRSWESSLSTMYASTTQVLCHPEAVVRDAHMRNCNKCMYELTGMYHNLENMYNQVFEMRIKWSRENGTINPDFIEFGDEIQELKAKWRKELAAFFNPDFKEF